MKRWLLPIADLPPQIIIILTVQRSGSTWLFDLLRAHPSIDIHPYSVIWDTIGCNGRRYPRDLSQGNDAQLNIEVKRGIWEKIPDFTITKVKPEKLHKISENSWFIEKLHPHFVNYDSQKFIQKINRLSKKNKVKLIYHVRSPQDSISSFLSYQKRNPNWYREMTGENLLKHMKFEYEFILDVSQKLNGIVTNYLDLKENTYQTVEKIINQLGSLGLYSSDLESDSFNLIPKMQASTSRDVRINSHTNHLFLGNKESEYKSTSDIQNILVSHKEYIDVIDQIYESIIKDRN